MLPHLDDALVRPWPDDGGLHARTYDVDHHTGTYQSGFFRVLVLLRSLGAEAEDGASAGALLAGLLAGS